MKISINIKRCKRQNLILILRHEYGHGVAKQGGNTIKQAEKWQKIENRSAVDKTVRRLHSSTSCVSCILTNLTPFVFCLKRV